MTKRKYRIGPVLPKVPIPDREVEIVAVLQDTQKVAVSVVLTDAFGEVVNNPVEWSTDGAVGPDGPIVTIEVAEDGTVFVVAGGDVGTSVVTATEVDAADGEGVVATLVFEVIASNAVTAQIIVGTPVNK